MKDRIVYAILLCLFVVLSSGPTAAQAGGCDVNGTIEVDTIWRPTTCTPYLITSTVVVAPGVTLTVEPGTQVKFSTGTSLEIQGTLIAVGTAEDRITFGSRQPSPAPGDWDAITFTDSSVDALFDANGNYVSGSIIQRALIKHGGGGSAAENGLIRIEASAPYIHNNTLSDALGDGLHAWNGAAPVISDNEVLNNGGHGIWVASLGSVLVTGNTVDNNTGSGIRLLGGGDYTIAGNTVTNNTSDEGGGIYTDGITTTVRANTVLSNTATLNGGGIFNLGAALILSNTITNNSAPAGGGLYDGGAATLKDNVIATNVAAPASGPGYGGGIYSLGATVVRYNTLNGNSATGQGGGIYFTNVVSGTSTIEGNEISQNLANQEGGGIYVAAGAPAITGNNIGRNLARYRGGGIYDGGAATINQNTISENSANSPGGLSYGGGIYSRGGSTIRSNTLNGNDASLSGGGIYAANEMSGTVRIFYNSLNNNAAVYDGGGIYNSQTAAEISGNFVANNTAGGRGGGVANFGFQVVINGNTINGNLASPALGYGGGIFVGANAIVRNNTIYANSASTAGGGLYAGYTSIIRDNVISSNATGGVGGGIYLGAAGEGVVRANALIHNTAVQTNGGGGLYCAACNYFLTEDTLLANLTGPLADAPNELYASAAIAGSRLAAEESYWGVSDPLGIRAVIWDFLDDPALGRVDYSPYKERSTVNVLVNPDFESGPGVAWVESQGVGSVIHFQDFAHSGDYGVHLCGFDSCSHYLEQKITVPERSRLTYWFYMSSDEDTLVARDFLTFDLYNLDGTFLASLGSLNNQSVRDVWAEFALPIRPYAGQTVLLRLTSITNETRPTHFYVDDMSLR
ncbi:MAG: right-handed parallel beta-helix repeat-containing protein [Chloroflexota bacterium]